MALIEYDPARVQAANQIREYRADALNKLGQVELLLRRIRLVQEQQMVGNPSFTQEDLDEVDAVVAEIHGAVGEQGKKEAPAMRVPEAPAPVVDVPVEATPSPLLAAEEASKG